MLKLGKLRTRATRSLGTFHIPIISCLSSLLFTRLSYGTTLNSLCALNRQIFAKPIHANIYTCIHTWPEPIFYRLLDSGFAPSALSLRLNKQLCQWHEVDVRGVVCFLKFCTYLILFVSSYSIQCHFYMNGAVQWYNFGNDKNGNFPLSVIFQITSRKSLCVVEIPPLSPCAGLLECTVWQGEKGRGSVVTVMNEGEGYVQDPGPVHYGATAGFSRTLQFLRLLLTILAKLIIVVSSKLIN